MELVTGLTHTLLQDNKQMDAHYRSITNIESSSELSFREESGSFNVSVCKCNNIYNYILHNNYTGMSKI